MSTSFTKKLLRVSVSLTSGTFDGSNNTVVLEGLKIDCHIKKGGEPSKNECKLKICGMLESDMNKLTTIPAKDKTALAVHKSILQVEAGDANGMNVAFRGNVTGAFARYNSPPNLVFEISAMEGYYPSIAPSKSKSYNGSVSVSSILKDKANEMGYSFEDNGVSAHIDSPYLEGDAYSQSADLADAADLEFGIDDGTMFIAPRGQSRGGYVPLISAASGLKDSPIFDKEGIKFSCLYNPALRLGGLCKIESRVDVANGVWRIHGLEHQLTSEDPSAKWFSSVKGTWIGSGK